MYRTLNKISSKFSYLYLITIAILSIWLISCKFTIYKLNQQSGNVLSVKRRGTSQFIKAGNKINCYMFILIMSSPKGALRRTSMRETWIKTNDVNKLKIERRFIIGTKGLTPNILKELSSEQAKHSDLLLLDDFADSYSKLTEKLLRTILWIENNVDAKFVMKVDDDSFVRLHKLIPSLSAKEHIGRIYWGFFKGNARIKRAGAWKETKWFLSDHYLPYAVGGGYVISFDLVTFISSNANYLSLYNSEDVSMGVWLASIKLNRFHDVRFDTWYKSMGCSNLHIVSHKQQPEDMYAKHNQLTNNGKLCKVEKELMLTWDYNWNEFPSNCCSKRVKISSIKTFL